MRDSLPAWVKDPDTELRRQAAVEQRLDHHASGCAVIVRALFMLLVVAGIMGGLLALAEH